MVRRRGLGEYIEHSLLQYISDAGLKPGDKLPPEKEISESLGVGRQMVREGMSRLRAMHLIQSNKGGGTVLCEPKMFSTLDMMKTYNLLTPLSAVSLMRMRILLEVGAARYIFNQATEKDIADLREITHKEYPKVSFQDIEFHSRMFRIANMGGDEFHDLIFTGFQVIGTTDEFAEKEVQEGYTRTEFEEVLRKRFPQDHEHICDVLENGTEDEFYDLIVKHLKGYDRLFNCAPDEVPDGVSFHVDLLLGDKRPRLPEFGVNRLSIKDFRNHKTLRRKKQ